MTTVLIVPNDTLVANGMVQPPGSTQPPHEAVTDVDNYTYLVIGGDFTFDLSTFTLPLTSVIRSANVLGTGLRGYYSGAMISSLRTALDIEIASFSLTFPYSTPGLGLGFDISGTPAAIAIVEQAALNGLRLNIRNSINVVSGEYYIYLTELAVQLVYVAPPVVTVGAPSGTITTAAPTLGWAYVGDVDADLGGVQQRYHVKVFSAAQYGAVGFDPLLSPAVYDSGFVISNATSLVVSPLLNGDYKTYVRAAQNVNGSPHWSVWDDGDVFTVDVDQPVVLTITATPLNAAGAVRIRVVRDPAHAVWTHIEVQRSVDGGVTWRPIRGGLNVPAPDDTMTIFDYEQPEGIPLRYRARGIVVDEGITIAQGDWKATTSPITWHTEGCGEWLRQPGNPAGGLMVEVIVDEEVQSTQHRIGLLDVIGRASPVSIWDMPALPVGVLSLATRTAQDERDLNRLLRMSPVLLYQGRPSWGHEHRWIVITNHSVSRMAAAETLSEFRKWDVAYAEVSEPPITTETPVTLPTPPAGPSFGSPQILDVAGSPITTASFQSTSGTVVQFDLDGRITGIRYQRMAGVYALDLTMWHDSDMAQLATVNDVHSAEGTFTAVFPTPVGVLAGHTYTFTYSGAAGNQTPVGSGGATVTGTTNMTFVAMRNKNFAVNAYPDLTDVQATSTFYVEPIYEPLL